MDKLENIVVSLKNEIATIESEIVIAKEKGFAYIRSRNIRKAAQSLKIAAQDLRTVSSEILKESK